MNSNLTSSPCRSRPPLFRMSRSAFTPSSLKDTLSRCPRNRQQLRAFWMILAHQNIRIFIATALPRAARIAEEDVAVSRDGEAFYAWLPRRHDPMSAITSFPRVAVQPVGSAHWRRCCCPCRRPEPASRIWNSVRREPSLRSLYCSRTACVIVAVP